MLDTNVLLAALHSRAGASHRIFRLVVEEKLLLALSNQVILEYDDVLKRKEIIMLHKLSAAQIDGVLDLLVLLAKKYTIYYRLRPNLPDENDNMFVECAFASRSQYLVTSNVKDFKRGELQGFGFKVVPPGDFYRIWRKQYE
ncbi:MAG: putative toxin-antitoxin system toxin component, PIN family [Gammaproteobacteria bacterium]|nr:putative toxin-antitoxin system toxin component, PIN family [Gammaproteobacteria bacterium]